MIPLLTGDEFRHRLEKSRIKIKDVQLESGLAPSTVSLFLNGRRAMNIGAYKKLYDAYIRIKECVHD